MSEFEIAKRSFSTLEDVVHFMEYQKKESLGVLGEKVGYAVDLIHITPTLAEDLLRYNLFNRNASFKRVKALEKTLRGGLWHFSTMPFSILVCSDELVDELLSYTDEDDEIALSKEKPYLLIDGQHTMQAILMTGKPIEKLCAVAWASSLDIQYTIDSSKMRTHQDAAVMAHERFGVTKQLASLMAEIASRILNLQNPQYDLHYTISAPVNENIRFVEDNLEDLKVAAEIALKSQKFCPSRGLFGFACFLSMQEDRDKAINFFRRVANNDALAVGSPEWYCRELLSEIKDKIDLPRSRTVKMVRAIQYCWIAYCQSIAIQKAGLRRYVIARNRAHLDLRRQKYSFDPSIEFDTIYQAHRY